MTDMMTLDPVSESNSIAPVQCTPTSSEESELDIQRLTAQVAVVNELLDSACIPVPFGPACQEVTLADPASGTIVRVDENGTHDPLFVPITATTKVGKFTLDAYPTGTGGILIDEDFKADRPVPITRPHPSHTRSGSAAGWVRARL